MNTSFCFCSSLNYSYYVTYRDYLKGPSSILLILFNFQGPSLPTRFVGRNFILPYPYRFVNSFFIFFSKFFRCCFPASRGQLSYYTLSKWFCQHFFRHFFVIFLNFQVPSLLYINIKVLKSTM